MRREWVCRWAGLAETEVSRSAEPLERGGSSQGRRSALGGLRQRHDSTARRPPVGRQLGARDGAGAGAGAARPAGLVSAAHS